MADLNTLIADLKKDDYYSRASAARALGELGGDEAAKALIDTLADEDNQVKEYAAEALGKLAHQPAVGPLGKLLGSDSYKVRCTTATALGNIGGDDARRLLEPLCEDSDSWVREAAVQALESIAASPAPAEPQKRARPAAAPEPIPAEAEPEFSVSEAPIDSAMLAAAAKHSLADRTPRTPEEIVKLVAESARAKYKATRSGFLLRVDVGGGRHQRMRLTFDSVDEDGSPIIKIFSVVGPAHEKHYGWALKMNPTFPYGALGIVTIDGKPMLAVFDTFLEENIDVKALKKSVWMLAKKADAIEKKLIKKDLW